MKKKKESGDRATTKRNLLQIESNLFLKKVKCKKLKFVINLGEKQKKQKKLIHLANCLQTGLIYL